jgi:Tfp pilus assembly protein PilV
MYLGKRLGFVLVELLVAVGISAVALVAIAGLASRLTSDAAFARHKTEANNLAREGVEWVKSERLVSGWSDVNGKKNITYCINDLTWVVGTCSGNVPGSKLYTRYLTLVDKNPVTYPPRLVATVTVNWSEARGSHTAVLDTELTNF